MVRLFPSCPYWCATTAGLLDVYFNASSLLIHILYPHITLSFYFIYSMYYLLLWNHIAFDNKKLWPSTSVHIFYPLICFFVFFHANVCVKRQWARHYLRTPSCTYLFKKNLATSMIKSRYRYKVVNNCLVTNCLAFYNSKNIAFSKKKKKLSRSLQTVYWNCILITITI